MKGSLHLIPAIAGTPHRYQVINRPVCLVELQQLVGGPIELVPELETVQQNGELRECVAFCHETGKLKHLPVNQWANFLWRLSLARKYGPERCDPQDSLVGDVLVVTGDDEFMEAL